MNATMACIPATVSFWLLGAHSLRAGNLGLALTWTLLPLLLFLKQRWSPKAAQMLLAVGIVLWATVGGQLIQTRTGLDQPWTRLALIIAGIMALATWAILLLDSAPVRQRLEQDQGPTWPPALSFGLTGLFLIVTRMKTPFAVLLPDRYLPGSGWLLILGLAVYAAVLTRAFLKPDQSLRHWARRRLLVWSLFSMVFFSQLAFGLAGADKFLMTGTLHLPVPALIVAGPLYRGEGLFMIILFLSTVVVVGPAWCSWLCYIGAWDAQAASTRRRPTSLPRWRNAVRITIAALVVLTAWGLRQAGIGTFPALLLASGFGLAGLGIMLTLSRRRGTMVHCTSYCPIGLLANILGRLHPFGIRINRAGCTDCGVCTTACRYDALDDSRIRLGKPGLSCTLCGDCVSTCPHAAMGYSFPLLSPSSARALFVILVVSAHAVFLGVARL